MSALGEHDLTRLAAEYSARERRFAGNDIYSPFRPAALFALQQRQRSVLKMLRKNGIDSLAGQTILEVGCGRGTVLMEFLGYKATPEKLHGTDLLMPRVSDAHVRLPNLPITRADGQNLPYQSGVFDLVLQFTVLSSVLDSDIRERMAAEMLRVLRPSAGMILWYDFWLNPINPTTIGVRKAEIKRLFPGCRFDFERVTLAPPIARRIVPVSWVLGSTLERLRILNSHYLVAVRPDG